MRAVNSMWRAIVLTAIAGTAGAAQTATPAATPYGTTVLHSFGTIANDASFSYLNRLVPASDGHLYGATLKGGANGAGAFFRLNTDGSLTILHSFEALPNNNLNGPNVGGGWPQGPIVQGADGNFYGTCINGGANSEGTVYRITPAGVFTVLHDFSALDPQTLTNTDGIGPMGLVKGVDGNLYGTTGAGGTYSGGVIYRLASNGQIIPIHNLGAPLGSTTEAAYAQSPAIQGSDGNFYGTATAPGLGVIYRVTPQGSYSTLYTLGNQASDGAIPVAGLTEGDDGNFYGATTSNYGRASTLFMVTPAGGFATLHTSSNGWAFGDNNEGSTYYAGLTKGADGNFYGAASGGGAFDMGTLFMMTPAGAITTLYSFGGIANDLWSPDSDLTFGADGALYSATSNGGTNGNGGVYRLPLPPPQGWGTGHAPRVSLTVSPSYATAGQTLTVSWNATGATSCMLQGLSSQVDTLVGLNGSTTSIAASKAGRYVYNLSCVGNGLTGHKVRTVTVKR